MVSLFHYLKTLNLQTKLGKDICYGRSVEQTSGFGLLLVAYTISTSSTFENTTILTIMSLFWAVLSFVLGSCQLLFSTLSRRLVFTALASVVWLILALYSFVDAAGQWNLATAASMPFVLFNFYLYGYVWNEYLNYKHKEVCTKNELNKLA